MTVRAPSPVYRTRVCALTLLASLSAACARGGGDSTDALAAHRFRTSGIEAHVRFLASDLLEGREAGTRGYDLAAQYVAAQFQMLGLRPAGDEGTYLQRVPLQAHWLVEERAGMTVRPDGGPPNRLVFGQDFIVGSSPTREAARVAARAVFAGFGIDAPVFQHNDYEGLDVRGAVVVVLAGYPSRFPSEEGAHYGSRGVKARAAAERGAIGTIMVYTDQFEVRRPWTRATANLDAMSMTWIGADGRPHDETPSLQVNALMSPAAAAVLFEGAPRSYADVRAEAVEGAPRGFPLAVSVDLAQASWSELRTSANVVAALPGSDPALRDEYVVLLGHLDHLGIGEAVNGDRIYNGAIDNAAGIAAMLEAARVLANAEERPRRSILFLAVTAEEKGLLGSDYFSRRPTVSLDRLVAAVNLDMPVLLYEFTDVIAFGSEHSTLGQAAEAAAKRAGLTLTPDPMPEQAIFTRSDHYRFVERGVPSIFLATGWNTQVAEGAGGQAFTGFLQGPYHRPQDDVGQPIDFAAGAKFAWVNALILTQIANADQPPRWNEGDFFGELFARRP
jgi:Zn-dependent M28 family amino/carboxypeptidase